MAGMLPGVEAARRRRFHQNSTNIFPTSQSSPTTSGRRSSFSLYASSHEFHFSTSSSFTQRNYALCDESSLGAEAREAKKRLDERLQPHARSQTARNWKGEARSRSSEVAAAKKGGGAKRLRWLKMRWKSSEQEECAVCLEQLKAAPPLNLMQLACGHRFHRNCLLPWLEVNAHCPCCRMQIPSSSL